MNISACLILRDNEKTILRCLESIDKYCFQIVCVIDNRTKDRTGNICYEFGCDVYYLDWETINDSFAEARNYTQTFANGDWILKIDGDEVLKSFIQPDNQFDYYNCPMERDNIRYNAVCLHKNNIGIKWERFVHEQIIITPGLKCGDETFEIWQEDKNPEQIEDRANSILRRCLKWLEIEPDNYWVNYYISASYRALNKWQDCLDYGILSLFSAIPQIIKAQTCILIYVAYSELKKFEIARKYLMLSLIYCPEQLTSRVALYDLYKEGNPEYAELLKQEILKIGNNSKLPMDIKFESINF